MRLLHLPEFRHSLGHLLIHLGDVLERVPVLGISVRTGTSPDGLPKPVRSRPNVSTMLIFGLLLRRFSQVAVSGHGVAARICRNDATSDRNNSTDIWANSSVGSPTRRRSASSKSACAC